MKDLLYHHKKPKNKQEMVKCIEVVWYGVTLEQLQTLIVSMPHRIQAMISAKGGSIRW